MEKFLSRQEQTNKKKTQEGKWKRRKRIKKVGEKTGEDVTLLVEEIFESYFLEIWMLALTLDLLAPSSSSLFFSSLSPRTFCWRQDIPSHPTTHMNQRWVQHQMTTQRFWWTGEKMTQAQAPHSKERNSSMCPLRLNWQSIQRRDPVCKIKVNNIALTLCIPVHTAEQCGGAVGKCGGKEEY